MKLFKKTLRLQLTEATDRLRYYEQRIPLNDDEAYDKHLRIQELQTTVLSLRKRLGYNTPMTKFNKALDKIFGPKKKK